MEQPGVIRKRGIEDMRLPMLSLILACSQILPAQTVSGVITGTVKDPFEAVLAGATLTLINAATGARHDTKTNEVGLYNFTSVQPGAYSLRIEQSGFKSFLRTNIVLTANVHLPNRFGEEAAGISVGVVQRLEPYAVLVAGYNGEVRAGRLAGQPARRTVHGRVSARQWQAGLRFAF